LAREKDFQAEDELRKNFQPSDFFFDFNNATIPAAPGVTIAPSIITNNKFLGTLPGDGVAHLVATVEGCAYLPPHVHPRATEHTYIIKGDYLLSFLLHL
jgi:quercetin dioxygenase-like cupin family protein